MTRQDFIKNVSKNRILDTTTNCWYWTRGKNRGGYSVVCIDGKNEICSRLSYEVFVGIIPLNNIVCHRCAKQEFYRRVLSPYEDKKIKENGDI